MSGDKPKSDAWIIGFAEAERQFYEFEGKFSGLTNFPNPYRNPFPEGTEQWGGFEEGVYTFTQK